MRPDENVGPSDAPNKRLPFVGHEPLVRLQLGLGPTLFRWEKKHSPVPDLVSENLVNQVMEKERTLRKKGTKEAGYDEEGDSDQEEVAKVFHPNMASVEAIVNGLVWWREGVLSNITATLERRLGERVPVNKNEENHPKERRDPEDRDDGGESGKHAAAGDFHRQRLNLGFPG